MFGTFPGHFVVLSVPVCMCLVRFLSLKVKMGWEAACTRLAGTGAAVVVVIMIELRKGVGYLTTDFCF